MIKEELVKRSPVRMLEKYIQGGIKTGTLGLITSERGVGKTACLVHLATDQLFQGKRVIHISFESNVDHIVNWYETIFHELSQKKNLESAMEIHNELIKNRVILNFSQSRTTLEDIKKSISTLVSDGKFKADTVAIDGYDFSGESKGFVAGLKKMASDLRIGIWLTTGSSEMRPTNGSGDAGTAELFAHAAVVISLHAQDDFISLRILKDQKNEIVDDLNLKLDPKTMLISESNDSE